MKGKTQNTPTKQIFLLLGMALILLEASSYAVYYKHLPSLISDVLNYDYQQKNWAFIPQKRSGTPLNDTLKIDLSEVQFQALAKEWNQQYKNIHRVTGKPWIGKKHKHKAQIKYLNGRNNGWKKAEISMMGMLPDHHGNFERMSLKVNLKGNNRLFHKKSFSLVLPETRGYFMDQIANQAYFEQYQGIQINTRPIWVQFRKNRPVVMLLEDKFDKFLVEANQRRESIIFEKGYAGHLRDIPGIEEEDLDWSCNATLSDSVRQNQLYKFVSSVFNDTVDGPFKYIDHHKTLGVWALGMVCASWHHWVDINMHWYYNPVNHKFEPTIREVNLDPKWQLTGKLNTFENRKKAYKNYLQKIQTEIVNYRPNFLVSYANWGENHIPFFWEKLDAEVGKAARKMNELLPKYKHVRMPLIESRTEQYHEQIQQLNTSISHLLSIPNLRAPSKNDSEQILISGKQFFSNHIIHNNNTNVIVAPGSHIRFQGRASIWQLNGAVHFRGTAQNPITIEADSNCRASLFIESQSQIRMEHVIFKGLSNLEYLGWKTPASITIHKTHNVMISRCVFEGNRQGDDYLNLFGCDNFTIRDCSFERVNSDAFDSDFSNGKVINTQFNLVGNDGIDGSGSAIEIDNCRFNHINDKAVSSGEKSQFKLSSSYIENSEIGLVSKDLSDLIVTHTVIKNVKLAAAIFQKKPEYGPASLEIDKDLNQWDYLVEKGSKISHRGKTFTQSKNVKQLLYGNEYGRATQK